MPGPSTINPTTFAWSYGTVAPLTGMTGVAGNALADVTATPTQTLVNNNFRVVGDKINQIVAVLQGMGTLT